MSIVHQTPTPAYPGRRWRARRYPGSRSVCPRFRAELRSDLATLAGVPSSLVEDVELCAGEAFANAVTHSRSQRPGGVVVRMLSTPTVVEDHTTLRLSILDDGPFDPRSLCVPTRCSVRGGADESVGGCCSSTNWPVSGEPSAGPTRAPRGSPARCCGPNSPTPPLPQLPPSPMLPVVFVGVGDEHRHHLHGSAPGAGRTPGPTLQPHPTPPRASRGNTFIDVGNTRAAATVGVFGTYPQGT